MTFGFESHEPTLTAFHGSPFSTTFPTESHGDRVFSSFPHGGEADATDGAQTGDNPDAGAAGSGHGTDDSSGGHDEPTAPHGTNTSAASREDSAFGMFGPSYGQPGYGQQSGGSGGGMFGRNQPMGPTIFLVPTRGMGSCSGNSAPNMVQLPSMYSVGLGAVMGSLLKKRTLNSFF